MPWWNLIFGGASSVVDAGERVVKTIWGSKAERDAYLAADTAAASEERLALMAAYASEFAARQHRTWFDSAVDGVNRLIRPGLAVGTQGAFTWAVIDPEGFVETMRVLAIVPDPLWVVWGGIIAFYFGGRISENITGRKWDVPGGAAALAKEISETRLARRAVVRETEPSETILPETVNVNVEPSPAPTDPIIPEPPLPAPAPAPIGRKVTRGVRNNNPGNIEGKFFGAVGNDGRFAVYATPADGIRAIEKQLTRYYTGQTTGTRLTTLKGMINTWAPPVENDTGAYIKHVSEDVGVDPNEILDWGNRDVRARVIMAIINHENGPNNPYSEEIVRGVLT